MRSQAPAQSGFSLIELMVGMAVGLIMMAAVVALSTSILRTNAETVTVAKLTQEGRAISDLASREVRRARFNGNSYLTVGAGCSAGGPFGDVFIGASRVFQKNCATTPPTITATATSGNCIRFAYDANGNGTLDSNEVKVISLFNNAVYFAQFDTYTAATCVSNATQAAAALRISSPDVSVTGLQFRGNTANGALAANVNRIDLDFRLALATNPSITRRFDQTVELRNPFL